MRGNSSILISDFDGTITREDFYALAVPRFLNRETLPDYWGQYAQGKLTHFEAMQAIFGHIRADEAEVREVLHDMRVERELAKTVHLLRGAGWDVEVVSAGCRWYIELILGESRVQVPVHASPGTFDPQTGLQMELPVNSPFCSPKTGIDKVAVVRDARRRYERVAFAGNGPPDLEAALSVEPGFRFARGWLAQELTERGEGHVKFSRWRDVAARILTSEQSGADWKSLP